MEARELSAAVIGALDEAAPIYAVLDGARNPRIHRWATTDAASLAWCLYRAPVNPDLAHVAPYLLRLGRGHDHTEEFFRAGWDDCWGVVLCSAAPSRVLRQHLRKHLKVLTEDNRGMLFRWYDPRVLRIYLPTCNAEELRRFFGPVQAFAAPTAQPGEFRVYRLEDGGLKTTTHRP